MKFGYWLPVFGGWLRNVSDEGMEASWSDVKRLAQRSEELGYDITLIAELFLNDIKGIDAPSLDAWTTAAALAAVTEKLELMVAVRPTFHARQFSPSRRRTSIAFPTEDSRSTSCRRGGRTRPVATGFISRNMTTDQRGSNHRENILPRFETERHPYLHF